jgi:hypothetical protein
MTPPAEIRDRLGVESGGEIPAGLVGSVPKIGPTGVELQTAATGRDSWANTTATDGW